jgi:hypothetical protein
MSLFHRHHEDPRVESPEDVFAVQLADGSLRDFRRDDFDEIFATRDREEMERQLSVGWLLLDERTEHQAIRPDIDHEFPAVTGMHLGGGTGLFTGGDDVTVWTVGIVREGVAGTPHEE